MEYEVEGAMPRGR